MSNEVVVASILTVIVGISLYWYFCSCSEKQKKTKKFPSAVCAFQGRRQNMEDAHCLVENIGASSYSFYSVFDGHGGNKAALFLEQNLHQAVDEKIRGSNNISEVINESILQMEKDFMIKAENEDIGDGSTIVCALVGNGTITIANVGDSEAVLCRDKQAMALTTVHTPSKNPEEVQRIAACGGRVFRGRLGHPHLNAQYFNIAVSRSIGDSAFKLPSITNGKESGLIATPDIRTLDITPMDEFLILACDGVWDVISHQEACDIISTILRESNDKLKAVESLVKAAYEKNSLDNITACLVLLNENMT